MVVMPTLTDIAEARRRQAPEADYGALKSVVCHLKPEARSDRDLTDEERTNLTTYLKYKTIAPHERGQFHVPGFTLHRRGFVHLPAMTGTGGKEMDHSALQGRFDEIEDLIVKGDRLWSIFTLRAKHVGPIYGRPATGKDLAITEMCCLRFEDGKLAEGWFLGDEVTICRQIGIDVKVPHVSAALPPAEALPAPGGIPGQDAIAARQGPGTDYGKLKSVIARRAAERRTKRDLTAMGKFLFMGVIGLILAGLVNMIWPSGTMSFIISAAGVLIFSGLIAYDTQKIKEQYADAWGTDMVEKIAIFGALSLYLDFVNLFQFLMSFLGERRD